jgi:predicted HAD superfamily Cof-like phosphohydrolase
MIKSIETFNRKIIGVKETKPCRLKDNDRAWLIAALGEELQEFVDSPSLIDDADALLDLCYFAIGGLVRSGLSAKQIEEIFNVIHNANMNKNAGIKSTRKGYDGVTDAIKPEGWMPPEDQIKGIIYG